VRSNQQAPLTPPNPLLLSGAVTAATYQYDGRGCVGGGEISEIYTTIIIILYHHQLLYIYSCISEASK